MELHALRVSITEQDLNALLRRYVPEESDVEDLRVVLTDHGVSITGVYPFFFPVRFETVWEIGVENCQASARLASFKAMGVPGNIFKSAVVKMVEDIARQESWIRIQGDRFLADVDLGCTKYGLTARLFLKSIVAQPGVLVIEAGQ